MCSLPPLRQKSICVRTQIAKTAHLPSEYIWGTFSTRTPSPFCAGSSWGLLSRKIFFDFYFSDSLVFIECLDWEYFFRFSYSISTRILFFLFFQSIASTRQVFTRYSLSAFIFYRFILVWFWFRIYFISFTIFDSDYNFGFCVFRFYISTRFYSLNFPRFNFDLFQHCRLYVLTLQLFISLTLLLVINKHLCLCEFVLCLFWLF